MKYEKLMLQTLLRLTREMEKKFESDDRMDTELRLAILDLGAGEKRCIAEDCVNRKEKGERLCRKHLLDQIY